MKIEQISYKNGIDLGVIKTEKFKNNYFGLAFVLPRTEENIAAVGMLSNVLKRGTGAYPTFTDITRRLSYLYDVSMNLYDSCSDYDLLFRISVGFIDDSFIPKNENVDVCSGALDCVREFLFSPLLENGGFKTEYVESERKRRIDKIKAEINNKDAYAYSRALRLACEGTPLACDANGTVESVSAVTAQGLYQTLQYIISSCPVEAVFSGRYSDENAKKIDAFLKELSARRDGYKENDRTERIKVKALDEVKEVNEQINAKQGRMVLAYTVPEVGVEDMSLAVFAEIFGMSPISRLFVNVRERLSLCYYCMASVIKSASVMTVRSGLDGANRQKAIDEIQRQLKDISDPCNISDEEFEAAKRSIVSTLAAVSDGNLSYASWYLQRKLRGAVPDIEAAAQAVKDVTKADVARIASGAKMQLSYFLEGTDK